MSKVEEFIIQERNNLKKKAFSFTSLVDLLVTYINEPEFESHVMQMEDEETVAKVKTYPVKKFRKMLKKVLMDFGVPEADAEKVVTEYKFKRKDVECIFEFTSDFMYQYLKTGRRLNLFEKEDLVGSIIADDVEESTKVKDATDSIPESAYHYKKHKKISSKSGCPKWKKDKLDTKDNSKVIASIKTIYKED